MTTRYAAKTEVPADCSRAEIEAVLVRYGADKFQYGWDDALHRAAVSFRLGGRYLRIVLLLPTRKSFRTTEQDRARTPDGITSAHKQAVRQRWRAAALIIKAKLEAIEAGISTIEQEFLAKGLLPNNQTVGEWLGPQVAAVYASGTMPRVVPGLPEPGPQLPAGEEAPVADEPPPAFRFSTRRKGPEAQRWTA
jgi:hypothetical protein